MRQIHNLVDWRTHLTSLRRMKEEDHIRYIGITHYTTGALPELARILIREPGIDFVQLGYSLAARSPETEVLPVAASRGVAVIAAGFGRLPDARQRQQIRELWDAG